MRQTLVYARMQWLQLVRLPGFLIPTLGFPALFFTFFDLGYARAHASVAPYLVLSYVAFAIIGVTLFQFGVGIANERATPWERYLRTLPAPVAVRFAGRILVAICFACVAAALVVAVALASTQLHFSAAQALRIAVCALGGGIVFTLFGIAIGYWCTPKSAIPIANLLYLLLSFAGGLWVPPSQLPAFAAAVSPFTPTRQFAELLWSALGTPSWQAAGALSIFAVLFGVLAALGYRRDERQKYA